MNLDISKAYSYARNERAKKAISILKEKLDEEVSLSSELNNYVWRKGAQNPPKKVEVEIKDGVAYPVE